MSTVLLTNVLVFIVTAAADASIWLTPVAVVPWDAYVPGGLAAACCFSAALQAQVADNSSAVCIFLCALLRAGLMLFVCTGIVEVLLILGLFGLWAAALLALRCGGGGASSGRVASALVAGGGVLCLGTAWHLGAGGARSGPLRRERVALRERRGGGDQ